MDVVVGEMDDWNRPAVWWKGLDLCRSSCCVVGVVLRGGGLRGERVLGTCHVLVRRDVGYRRLICLWLYGKDIVYLFNLMML